MYTFVPGVNTIFVWNHCFLAPVVPGVIVAAFAGTDNGIDKIVACTAPFRGRATTEMTIEFVAAQIDEDLAAGRIFIPAEPLTRPQFALSFYDVAVFGDTLPEPFYIDIAQYKI